MKKIIIILSMTFLCIGCASPEFKSEFNSCQQKIDKEMPAIYEIKKVDTLRPMSIPTSSCYNNQCTSDTTTQWYNDSTLEKVETNSFDRTYAVGVCAQKKCRARGLNSSCR